MTHSPLRFSFLLALALFLPNARAASTFVSAYSAGPVKWQSWNHEAFARAKSENKPVFVFIGTATSELARAEFRQTFSNPEAAAFLNDSFVCVVVDAKEQPELTALYQNYLAAVKQLKGLPMNLFLTPDLKPFDGANYLPPTEEWGKEGFLTVAKRAVAGWKADPAAQRTKAEDAISTTVAAQSLPAPGPLTAKDVEAILKDAAEAWKARFDSANGGFGDPPRYVEPELLRFLLRDAATRDLALQTLRAAINGAARDPLDGGFFRYALDAEWHQPYFQKNLIDQPRIALALLEAAKLSDDTGFAEAARAALHYAVQQLGASGKDASATEDATVETLVASYLWTMDEIKAAAGADKGAEFAAAYGATAEGNLAADAFPNVTTAGKNLLRRVTPRKDAAAEKSLNETAAKLLERRKQRPAPVRDNAAPVGTHGLLLAGLAQGGAQLKDTQLTNAAKAEFELIRDQFAAKDGSLRRLPNSPAIAAADDYAAVISGLLAYSSTANDPKAGQLASRLTKEAIQRFWDAPAARFFATGPEDKDAGVWARVHFVAPGAGDPPSAESLLLLALAEQKSSDSGAHDLKDALARSVASDVKEAAEAARGDLLLSLQAYQQHR